MKIFPRVTNSFAITAALLAVIISSLCFSVGEGLRLTPFPSSILSLNDSGSAVDVEGLGSFSKYGPLDVPTQTQKRSKRNVLDLAAGPRAEARPVLTSVLQIFLYQTDSLDRLPLVVPPPGRAPPPQS